MDFETYRELFPITRQFAFLNHAATSPPSVRVVSAISDFYNACANKASKDYKKWMSEVEVTRTRVAQFIHGYADEIAFVGNTSEGLSTVALGFKWKPDDVVLVTVPDFPANIYPWMHLQARGVRVNYIQRRNGCIDVEDIKKTLVPKTRMLVLSSVDYVTGFSADLEEIGKFCKEKGLFFCVDAIQSLGIIPMDVKKFGIHFLAAGGHKWLTGPMGIGILFIDRNVNTWVTPTKIGWKSVENEEDFQIHFNLKKDALRFEPGTMNLSGIFGLGAAIELLDEIGVENIYKKVMSLNDYLIHHLKEHNLMICSPSNKTERSGILSFKPAGDPVKCFEFLSSKHIMVSLRNNNIRLSPHFYNNTSDAAALIGALDTLCRT
jgi:selenocysteine lyase/cysteine desulfurase